MTILKQFTLFRLYLGICVLALSAFSYAEYYGYVLTGSDEHPRNASGGSHYYRSGSGAHHK
jgi:hypothetical protein